MDKQQSTQATRKQYGPFNLNGANGLNPKQFLALGWQEVCGSTVVVSVTDNFAALGITASTFAWAIAEITIYGVNGGIQTKLKTQELRMLTGPMVLTLPYEQAYDELQFAGRPMIAGIPQRPLLMTTTFDLNANVFVTPRGGFNIRGR